MRWWGLAVGIALIVAAAASYGDLARPLGLRTPEAEAANGAQLRQIIADRSGTACASYDAAGNHRSVGVGIAFDGKDLLISCYGDNTITRINASNGAKLGVHTISNASSLGAMAWDNDLKTLWACSHISTVGTVNLTTNQFTPKFATQGCFDGLAYDGADKTFWTSGDVSSALQHYSATGVLLSNMSLAGKIGSCGSSGIAVGGSKLYLANNGCSQIFEASKDLSSSTLFATFPRRLEDLECDNITFAGQGKAAIWSIDAYDNILNAWEIPVGACFFGGQAISDFSQNDLPWGPQKLYFRNECGTVDAVGCAMTAVADVAASYGIKLSNGSNVNPGTLNEFLKTRMSSCMMDWWTAGSALGLGKATVVHTSKPLSERLTAIDNALRDGNLAIIGVKVPASPSGKHFLVVYEKVIKADNTPDYRILDPEVRSKTGKLLSEAYKSVTDPDLQLQVTTFASGVHPQRTFVLLGHSPIELVVTDPLGRQTGFDPTTGTSLQGIADTTYGIEPGVFNFETGTGSPDTLYFQQYDPLDGAYTVKVIGTGTGPYTLDFVISTADGGTTFTSITGNATMGSLASYKVQLSGGALTVQHDVPSDTTPPTTKATAQAGDTTYSFGSWAKADVAVTLQASDGASGSGIKNLTYSTSGAHVIPSTTVSSATALVNIPTEGQTILTYSATDNDGNVETPKTVTVKLDKAKPVTTSQVNGTLGTNGWYTSAVSVGLTPSDGASGSGINKTYYAIDNPTCTPASVGTCTTYSAPFSVTSDGTHSVTFFSGDNAGNMEVLKTLTVPIDKMPPAVTYTGNAGTYSILASVSITCAATDAVSGVASTTCQNITGYGYSFQPGLNSFSATATDNAGNTGNGSTSFTVQVTFDDLCTLSRQFVTNAGVQVSQDMCAQLNAAQKALARGDTTTKAKAMQAYKNAVDAAVLGGFLTADRAAILTKLAAAL